ncbi:DNA-3-methyladenine glycosylase I [uncultured Vagococcus sp.]|uniref:DNA-3-methyladenine glycosylase I n=1 Tax=uncultured Vagococcus sp. TaxID=189676 RepID=UPI0028D36AAC|nr:DNA-3-methyladenine glycosylase I [uncultured Vagococcus sp.]
MNQQERCSWANSSPLEQTYHDHEWGVPKHEDLALFELLSLESMQAGLSWSTILAKRETLNKGYDQFNPEVIATYDQQKIDELLADPGVIRHKLKIAATISNAQRFLEIQKEYGSFDQFIWTYVNHRPINNLWSNITQVPATSDLSVKISKDLKKIGFKFVGPTTIYSFLQAAGLINDHVVTCFRNDQTSYRVLYKGLPVPLCSDDRWS